MSVLNDWIIYTVCVSALARVAVVVHSRVERVCLTATTLAAIVCQANPTSLSLLNGFLPTILANYLIQTNDSIRIR